MFSKMNKPPFGTTTTTTAFGFGNTPNQKLFSQAFASFGKTSGLGSTSQQPFGASLQNNKFSNLFSQQNSTNSAPFSQNKSTDFGFKQSNTSLFSQSTTSLGLLGATAAQTGTLVKHSTVYGTDYIQKNGIPTAITTKLWCITCMKEYENKSLEELRFEDYQSNRKGAQQQNQPPSTAALFGQTPVAKPFGFGTGTATNSGFGTGTATNSGFGTGTATNSGLGTGLFSKPNFFGLSSSTTTLDTKSCSMQTQSTPTSTNPLLGFGAGSSFGQTKPAGLFSKFAPTTTSTQSQFTFTPQTSFEPRFKINSSSFTPTTSTITSFVQPMSQPVQTTINQLGFGNTTQQSKPIFSFPTQTQSFAMPQAQPQPQQCTLRTSEQFEQQLEEFHKSVQNIFQPFPHREFLKTPKSPELHTIYPKPKPDQAVIEKAPTIVNKFKTTPTIKRTLYLMDDIPKTPETDLSISLRSSGRCLVLGRKMSKVQEDTRILSASLGRRLVLGQKVQEDRKIISGTGRQLLLPYLDLSNISDSSEEDPGLPPSLNSNFSELDTTRATQTDEIPQDIEESPACHSLFDTDDEMNSSASAELPVPCIIKLERPGYYTIPPQSDLHKYVNNQGQCLIKGFTIGCEGYGKIYFPAEIDVTNLDLDQIVNFGYREVVVYANENQKPPVGQGLNRPAEVTLDQIWPLDKITDMRLKDPEDIQRVNFTGRLSLLSERQGCKFVEYRPATGSWVFSVKHFSKFWFDDDADQEVAEMIERQKALEEKPEEEMVASMPTTSRQQPSDVTLMKSSFFNETIETQKVLKEKQPSNIALMKSTFFNESTEKVAQPEVTSKNRIRTNPPRRFQRLSHTLKAPIISTINTRNCADVSLFKNKAFKVGWGHQNELICKSESYHLIHLKFGSNYEPVMDLNAHMETVLNSCSITSNHAQVPLCTIRNGWETLLTHQSIATGFFKQVWDVCLALWGPDATTATAKRELFSKWLEDVVSPCIKTDLDLFELLSAHQISTATKFASIQGLPHLAALIAQAGSQESTQELIHNQIEQWKDMGCIKLINRDILRLYMLLGGVPVVSDLNVCENLDWKRALGVHLWYMCPPGVSIVRAIKAYEMGFELGYACPPNGDVLYHIMLLHGSESASLTKLLNPLTYTNDPLDYRLSWLLLQAFTALKVGTLSPQVADYVHVSFASQLENMGQWIWAVFVLLFIKDTSMKTNAIMGVLDRNASTIDDALVTDLKILPRWIHKLLAEKAAFSQKHIEAFTHLVYSYDWHKAHTLAVFQLVPTLMQCRQHDQLILLLKNLLPFKDKISSWYTGAGLVLDILNLHRKLIDNNSYLRNVTAIRVQFVNLCQRMKHFPTNTPEQVWAASELSKLLIVFLRMLCKSMQPCTYSNVQLVIAQMESLIMPPDYKMEELRAIIHDVAFN